MKLVIEILKKYWIYYMVSIVFCSIIYYLAYTYPLVYDDTYFAGTYPNTGWQYLNFNTQIHLLKSMYNLNGRIGHSFIYLFIHFKILSSVLSVLCVLLLFILIPVFIAYNNQSDKKHNFFKNGVISFGIMSLFTIFFPWQFFLLNDFFIKTMFLAYILPTVIAWLFVMITWCSVMDKNPLELKRGVIKTKIINICCFGIGIFTSIFSELFSIYMIGMIIGVYILAFIRYKKINKIPIFLISLYSGIISGTMLVLTSPGVRSALFNPNTFRKLTTFTDALQILNNELSFIFLICFGIICILAIILYLLFRKNSIKLIDKSELIWRSIYLLSVYLGFVLILFITRIPYLRSLITAATILPLVYLIVLLVINIGELLPKSINYIMQVCSLIIVTYLMLITIHNSYLVKNIDSDFTARINNFQNSQDITNDKFIIPVYEAPFKHITNKDLQGTSEMTSHLFLGTSQEYQLSSGRLFIHVISPQGLKNLYWKAYFNKIGRDTIDFENQSVTNHIISPIEFLN